MGQNVLNVELREGKGKGVARKLRAAGRVPAVCYGQKLGNTPIAIDPRALDKLIEQSDTGINTLIDLAGGGELDGAVVLVREIQRDPVKSYTLHVDFYAIDLEERIEVSVPIHITGKAPGVEMGGILDHSLRDLEVRCFPRSIPSEIPVDVSTLDLGDNVHVRDLPLPEGVELVSDGDLSVVSVVAPAAAEEEAAAVEGEEVLEGEAAAEAAPAEKAEEGGEKPEASSGD